MEMHGAAHREILGYFAEKAPVVYFVLAADGEILECNRFAERTVGVSLPGKYILDVVVDFSGRFDLASLIRDGSEEHLLNIKTRTGLPQSLYFSFKQADDRILALGRLDAEELEIMRKEIVSMNQDLNNLTRQLHKTNAQRDRLIKELREALAEIKTLSGLLPICAHCKKIRDDQGYWQQIEAYIQDHSDAKFSHGICRECAKKYYPDMDLYEDEE